MIYIEKVEPKGQHIFIYYVIIYIKKVEIYNSFI